MTSPENSLGGPPPRQRWFGSDPGRADLLAYYMPSAMVVADESLLSGLSPSTRTSASGYLSACGHVLDPHEIHLEHRPDCPREPCADDRCDCPEVCPDCCTTCTYDLAERMGS